MITTMTVLISTYAASITIKVVILIPIHDGVYLIPLYVYARKFVSNIETGLYSFLWVLCFLASSTNKTDHHVMI